MARAAHLAWPTHRPDHFLEEISDRGPLVA